MTSHPISRGSDEFPLYPAHLLKVVDGDTVHLEIDLGLETYRRIKCRLYGINAPEMSMAAGELAKKRLVELVLWERPLLVKTYKDRTEKYGRYLVEIYTSELAKESVNEQLVREGFAVKYLP